MEPLPPERALRSPSVAQLAAALAAAQGAFPVIPRDREVTVTPRRRDDGYQPPPYKFKYAPLATVLEKVRPALANNGLALTQAVVVVNEKGHEAVRTTLYHSSGEFLANETPLFVGKADNASQGYASGMTYARRYGVTTLLCVAADDDDDASGTDGEDEPRATAGRKAASKPAVSEPKAKPQADAGASQTQGAPLGDGPRRLLEAKAKAAGLTMEEVTARFGEVTMTSLNATLASLGELANGGGAQ